ncbi:ABC-type transport system substrate-binding protein [Inhella inkyongensis]|uniref:ABC-type transport system substrate-binding protein n=1 Tax=Inhella inkyongensis TaxID=392593 RepID=A0A840RZQ2_9BURK|nr:ABC transporter substrate-binding protein [Inhella inkyongensis]MBB5202712.1 ABC-type transport system substrate-binding protein [Inhella inkyongensis]
MRLTRRQGLLAATASAALGALPVQAAAPKKVFRMALVAAETGFDPVRISDTYSRLITSHIFEALYAYDPVARPVKIVPNTAVALPEANEDFTRFIVRLQPGIYFQDDPVFKGQRRELVAQDYVYSFKRAADPKNVSPMWPELEEQGFLGLSELRAAVAKGKAFDYDREIEGLRALDRYTLELRVKAPRPRLIEILAQNDLRGAVAREVIEAYADDTHAHPVGTGPFRLAQWRRSSLIVLERNEGYRERYFDGEARDEEGRRILAQLKGRRLPMIDRVEVTPIEEEQPRWLSFLGGEHDFIERVPGEYAPIAFPNNKLAPNLAKRGIQHFRHQAADCAFTFFNMEDEQVGGFEPHRVALRRAISLALDIDTEVYRIRRGQAIHAQSLLLPHTTGYDPQVRTANGEFSPSKAKALLDLYGYKDRDGDGWREHPDGRPLRLSYASQPDNYSRRFQEMWLKNLKEVGLRMEVVYGQWPEQLKQARAGKLMLWFLGSTANYPDGIGMLQRLYGPQSGNQNYSRFKLPEYDRLYERALTLPDGAERASLFRQAQRIQVAYMPMKVHVHRILNDLAHPWVVGYRRPLFRNEFFHFIDIDLSKLPA